MPQLPPGGRVAGRFDVRHAGGAAENEPGEQRVVVQAVRGARHALGELAAAERRRRRLAQNCQDVDS